MRGILLSLLATGAVMAAGAASADAAEPERRSAWPMRIFARKSAADDKTRTELPPKEAARACLATADELIAHGHRRDGILLYERARALDPSLKRICRQLAVLYDQEGRHNEALAEYNKALEQTPRDADLLCDLGFFYYLRDDLPAAEQWLKKALHEAPEHTKARMNLALVWAYQGRLAESFEAFSGQIGPAGAHSNIGMVLAKQGQREAAVAALRNALALEPELPQAQAVLKYLAAAPLNAPDASRPAMTASPPGGFPQGR
jgi:Flp pilus assembly protein TadD